MSVVFRDEVCCLLDHQDYISKMYSKVNITPKEFKSFIIKKIFFSISNNDTNTLKTGNHRKRKKYTGVIHQETSSVLSMFENFLRKVSIDIIEKVKHNYKSITSTYVRNMAMGYFESTVFDHSGISGRNDSNLPLKCCIHEDYFLLPENSQFFCGDVNEYCKKSSSEKFDIVIADPPWWNKYIRRLKAANSKLSYSMMYNEEIASIPIQNLFANNCLVAVWCTNSPSNVAAVKELIFPKWGVEYVTTWYWLKVTIELKPLCEFGSGCKKQPYERIIIGKVGNVRNIPEEHLIISIPSALHSHKPPLIDVLKPYVESENPQTLELFARYLLPNTTSVGYEPLKWQHISLYEHLDPNDEEIQNTV